MFNTRELSWSDLLKGLSGRLIQGNLDLNASGVGTNSRTLQSGNIFVALKGPHFDGHTFVPQALEGGAAAAIVADWGAGWSLPTDKVIIQVEDTLKSLGDLAHLWRRRFFLPLIGLSGSNGKTTTKEMIAAILNSQGPALKNPGNLNNLIGLPLTLLTLGREHRSAVLEMGMNHPGEIRRLAEIAVPTVGLLTNIGPAHLEGLGSLAAVARAKGELFESLSPGDTAVINLDDPLIREAAQTCPAKKIYFGLDPRAQVYGEGLQITNGGTRFLLGHQGVKQEIRIRLWGEHQVRNALGAAAACWALGLPWDRIREGLENFSPPPQRFQLHPGLRGSTLIDDSYNANPASVKAALQTFQGLRQGRPGGLVLGDMLELGDFSEFWHLEIGRLVGELHLDYLVTLGPRSQALLAEARKGPHPPRQAIGHLTQAEVIETLRRLIRNGDWILIKGSHGLALETIVRALGTDQG